VGSYGARQKLRRIHNLAGNAPNGWRIGSRGALRAIDTGPGDGTAKVTAAVLRSSRAAAGG
jgi:hypothetical protein